jgi:hypothetical protein
MSGGYTSPEQHQRTPTCNSGGRSRVPAAPGPQTPGPPYKFWYSGPSPPSGVVNRPPFAVIAPHWTQFV